MESRTCNRSLSVHRGFGQSPHQRNEKPKSNSQCRSCSRSSRSQSRSRSRLSSRSDSRTSQRSQQGHGQGARIMGPHTPVSRRSHNCEENRSYSRSVTPRYNEHHGSSRARKYYNCCRTPSPYSRSPSLSSRQLQCNERHKRISREKPPPSRCLGVFGLNIATTQHKIREIFSKYGPIERIQVVIDAQTGHSRGFCFIYYENLADAKSARYYCCGLEVDGRRIRVDYSITEKPHTPTPGIYKGRTTRYIRDKYYTRSRRKTPSSSPYPRYVKTYNNNNYYHRRNYYNKRNNRSSSYTDSPNRSRYY